MKSPKPLVQVLPYLIGIVLSAEGTYAFPNGSPLNRIWSA